MKKIIIPIGALLITGMVQAQLSPTENYVYSKTILDYNTSNVATKTSETVQYFDGLGRPKQIINIKASPTGKDVVTPIEYDGFGRQVKDYLPIPQGQTLNGGIVSNPLANVINTPYGQEKIYAEKTLENSPLDRLLEQKQVGTAWNDKPLRFQYDANIHEDYVRKYKPTTIWDPAGKMTVTTLELLEYFLPNTLYKNTVTDEDGNKTIEFKNGRGQVVLVRKVISSTENADTYYVYNEYDQLAFVIPPGSPATPDDTALNNFCYQYRYDGKSRLVEKKLPGKGWEFMVYDKADRLVMTQDANMKPSGNWLFTKYDKFSRVLYTGIAAIGAQFSRGQVQYSTDYYIDQGQPSNEERNTTGFTNSGMTIYYGNTVYPTTLDKVLSVNYYDTYPTYSFNPAFPANVFAQPVLTDNATGSNISTKGLPVMSLVKNIEDDNWTKNYTYYDNKGRVISTHSINHLGGFTRTSSDLNFSGIAKQTLVRHKRLATDTERSIREVFTYDNQNRLLTRTHQVGTGTIEYLAQNKYNELSQLEWKKVGGVGTTTPLQQVDYKYNIRGWMTQINDPTNLGSDLFGYKIKYNQVEGLETPNTDYPALKVAPRYNGNIAEVDWKTSSISNDNIRRYGYVYDNLNRLLAGFYQKDTNPSGKEYFEKMDYDLNGNITNVKRSADLLSGDPTSKLIDNLKYDYLGNRLTTVKEQQQNSTGYPYFATPNVITYDNNGNMTSHKDKGIQSINYNFLNLPNTIKVSTEGTLFKTTNYIYRADGTKLRKNYVFGLANSQTDYLDGFQYLLNDSGFGCVDCPPPAVELQFVPTSEGYYDFVKNKYIYNYTDHLGNVRLSYQKGALRPEIIEENNYYPFGLKHEGYNGLAGNPAYQYKYNGKELQETGMYDYGARMYMPEIGRWGVIDPLAEKFHSYSPYNYVMNDPIANYDPDGMDVKNDYKLLQNGQVRLIRETNDNSDTLYATDKNGKVDNSKSVTVAKAKASDSSIIGDLATGGIPDNTMHYTGSRKAFPLGVNRARTTDASDASNVFLFAANNSNVEWGLAGYNTGKTMTYALWTGHSEDTTPNSVLYQGISKLSFEIHTHPGSVTFPTPVNSMTEGDYGSAAWIDSEFAKNRNYPRHFLYSQQDKHLWEYNYYNETSAKFYPGRPGVNKPMPINSKINLKTLRK